MIIDRVESHVGLLKLVATAEHAILIVLVILSRFVDRFLERSDGGAEFLHGHRLCESKCRMLNDTDRLHVGQPFVRNPMLGERNRNGQRGHQ